ncbi:MAG: succinic semialdehyde dehydrogenase [Haloarculaceae archaeon]
MTTLARPDRWPEQAVEQLLEGAAVDADTQAESVQTLAPYTAEPITSVPCAGPDAVSEAVGRAREAQSGWAERDQSNRAEILREIGETVRQDDRALLDLAQFETGKSRWDAFEEVLDVVATADHYAANAEGYAAPERRAGAIPGLTRSVVHHRPRGVVGLISPWNYPVTLAVSDAIPALLGGNAVVLKPALETTLTALRIRELVLDAGVPPACFQVVPGRGPDLGPAIVDHCDYVGFTGSTAAGREVAAGAGEALTPVSLELGGKNPLLVLSEADVDRAAMAATRACFANAGQLCIATERLYVQEAVFDPFRDAFVAATERLAIGRTYDFGPDVGSLISAEHCERVEGIVEEALDADATLLTGGRRRADVGPWFYEPTVLTDVDPDLPVATAETFGPVVTLHAVPDEAAAVARANDTDYGLHASVWTGDAERGEAVADRIDAGSVCINDAYVASWGSTSSPMGGMNHSGIGRRHGREGYEKYTEAQTIATQHGHPLVVPEWLPTRLAAAGARATLRVRDWVPGWPP